MYEAFFGFREKPFSLLPDPTFLYLTDKHRRALTLLEYGLTSQSGFTVVTGEIGSGKTTLVRKLLQSDDPDVTVGLINNTQCGSIDELLRWVAFAFNLNYSGRHQVELYDVFTDFLVQEYASGRRVVLIIDEAQQLGLELLEQVRMLSNINADKHQVIQFILVGQPNLRSYLRRPELVQFAQRIVVDYHLQPLDEAETVAYIRHRLTVAGGSPDLFTPAAASLIWRHARGVPRIVNMLCDTALVYAFSDQQPRADEALVREVLKDKSQGLAPVGEQERDGSVSSLTERANMIEKLFGN
jgi:type II secretory pathway predicted ATPase ExeA